MPVPFTPQDQWETDLEGPLANEPGVASTFRAIIQKLINRTERLKNLADELENAVVVVDEGTSAGTTYRQTSVNFTLGTGPVNWTTFGTSAPPASETTAGIIEMDLPSQSTLLTFLAYIGTGAGNGTIGTGVSAIEVMQFV